jgi:hypothetical protein
MCADQRSQLVEIGWRQDERHSVRGFVFADELILGEEVAALLLALAQQVAVGIAIVVKQGVVAGGTQIAAQLA